jgi:hypothetical protein
MAVCVGGTELDPSASVLVHVFDLPPGSSGKVTVLTGTNPAIPDGPVVMWAWVKQEGDWEVYRGDVSNAGGWSTARGRYVSTVVSGLLDEPFPEIWPQDESLNDGGWMSMSFTLGVAVVEGSVTITATCEGKTATCQITVVTAEVWEKKINFRATEEFVVDGSNETFCIADTYPVTRSGVTFGWTTPPSSGRDRNGSVDRRFAGMNQKLNTGVDAVFRIDLPAAGNYELRLAFGDVSFGQGYLRAEILDGSTSRALIVQPIGSGGEQFIDASGVTRNMSDWPSMNTPITVAMSGTVLNIRLGSIDSQVDASKIAHLHIKKV